MGKKNLKQKIDRSLLVIFLVLLSGGTAFFGISIYKMLTKTSDFVPQVKEEKFSSYYKKAQKVLDKMSVDEKIGQFLFARVPEQNVINDLEQYHLGGYILFGRDVNGQSLEQIKNKVDSWQAAAKYGMFIGIDEEGGTVSRLTKAGLADFKSPQDLFAAGGMDAIEEDAKNKNQILEQIGVNVNFAPVADVVTDKKSFIFNRSFGQDANKTAEFIKNVVELNKRTKVSATLKHFPGYGNNLDTHETASVDRRSLEEFRANDFVPFKAGIEAGADFVMVSHNIIAEVDNVPASISAPIHKILNDELGFSGVIITDDLSMAAIAKYYAGQYSAEVQAILAGNNMLIVTDYWSAFESIKKAVADGVISNEQIDYLLLPVISLKIQKNLIKTE